MSYLIIDVKAACIYKSPIRTKDTEVFRAGCVETVFDENFCIFCPYENRVFRGCFLTTSYSMVLQSVSYWSNGECKCIGREWETVGG